MATEAIGNGFRVLELPVASTTVQLSDAWVLGKLDEMEYNFISPYDEKENANLPPAVIEAFLTLIQNEDRRDDFSYHRRALVEIEGPTGEQLYAAPIMSGHSGRTTIGATVFDANGNEVGQAVSKERVLKLGGPAVSILAQQLGRIDSGAEMGEFLPVPVSEEVVFE